MVAIPCENLTALLGMVFPDRDPPSHVGFYPACIRGFVKIQSRLCCLDYPCGHSVDLCGLLRRRRGSEGTYQPCPERFARQSGGGVGHCPSVLSEGSCLGDSFSLGSPEVVDYHALVSVLESTVVSPRRGFIIPVPSIRGFFLAPDPLGGDIAHKIHL